MFESARRGFTLLEIVVVIGIIAVLMADLNPGTGAGKNNHNHEGRGQNVLFTDSHVEWKTTRLCGVSTGPDPDDIYTTKAGTIWASPVDGTDSILLPTDQ